jgi:hypothetical protein
MEESIHHYTDTVAVCGRRGWADYDILGNARDTSREGKLSRILLKILSYHHDNGNVLNQSSMDIDLFKTNL